MIVQAHGHFDLLHPGHIKHLKQAEQLTWNYRFKHKKGILVVTLTAGRWMTKPGHPIFTDSERLEMLQSLRFVDQVFIIDSIEPYPAIDLVKPDIYVKGVEYEGCLREQKYCEERGIEVRFLGKKIYGSTTIANQVEGFLRSSKIESSRNDSQPLPECGNGSWLDERGF